MKIFRPSDVGISAACAVLLGQLVLFVVLVDQARIWEFLTGSASSWIQAVGSIAAILASYKLGERTLQRQLKREEISSLQQKLTAFKVLHVILEHADTVNQLSEAVYKNRAFTDINIQAKEALQMLSSVPMLEVPDSNLVRSLSLARQSMSMYIHWCTIWSDPFSGGDLNHWSSYASMALEDSTQAVFYCEHSIVIIERKLKRLSSPLK